MLNHPVFYTDTWGLRIHVFYALPFCRWYVVNTDNTKCNYVNIDHIIWTLALMSEASVNKLQTPNCVDVRTFPAAEWLLLNFRVQVLMDVHLIWSPACITASQKLPRYCPVLLQSGDSGARGGGGYVAHLQPAASGGQPESLHFQVTTNVCHRKATDESCQYRRRWDFWLFYPVVLQNWQCSISLGLFHSASRNKD